MSNVISGKQQKTTLRGKKGKKESLKNVLASPYTHYWPLISNEDNSSLKQILKNTLPKVKEQTKNIPWEEIKHIPKEERREYRKKKLNLSIKSVDSTSKYMYFGINEVTKLLERNEAISVLLSHDVLPQLMIKHIVDLCVFKKVPILVMFDLKYFLKETVGISAAAVGFKTTVQNYLKVDIIHKAINDVFTKHPIPKNHACYPKPELKFFDFSKFETIKVCKMKEEEEPIENVYLYKNSTNTGRVFVPRSFNEGGNIKRKVDMMETDSSGFLSFNDDTDKTDVNYTSLIVKCVHNNPDRNKKKFNMIKNKKRKRTE